MPTVPTYAGPRVRTDSLKVVPQDINAATASSRATAREGADLMQAGNILDRTADREATRAAYEAETKVTANYLEWENTMRTQRTGAKAEGIVKDTDAFLKEQAEAAGKDLTPYAKSIANQSLGRLAQRARAGAMGFEQQQLDHAFDQTVTAAKKSMISITAANPTPENVDFAVSDLKRKNADWGARRGWTPEMLERANIEDTTTLHRNVINGMQQLDPQAAENYFNRFKDQIDGTVHDEIKKPLVALAADAAGEKAAAGVWQSMGPKTDTAPVELDKMEAKIREQFKDEPVKRKAAVAALREQATAHNQSQKERAYGNTNAVMDALSRGMPMAQVQRTPEFQALPGKDRMQIIEHLEARATAAASRAASNEQRALASLQRGDILKERQAVENGNYYKYNDPEYLKTASPAEIQALAPQIGVAQAKHLMDKKQQIAANPKAEVEAKVDKQDFDAFITRMGMDPLSKDDKVKGAIGETQFRVEQLISAAQAEKKGPLTRAEKNQIMNREIARTATVDGWFSNTEKPVIAMTADDIAKVVIPRDEREEASRALKDLYAKNPRNPAYAPTEENLRRLYLRAKSRSAALIPEKAK